jgi:putative salt-induced outer membrane protein
MKAKLRRFGSRLALAVLLLLPALAGAPEGRAQSLPPVLASAIAEAAGAANATRLRAVVVESIAAHPSLADAILRTAIARRPGDSAALLAHAQAAFPAFADRLAAATGQSAILANATTLPAQPSPATAAPSPWSGELDLGASRVTGNTESAELNLKSKVKHEAIHWRNEGRFQFDFGDDDNVTNERSFLFSFETNYKLTPRFYLFGIASYEDDAFSGFAFRTTETVGAGYGLIRLSDLSLDVEAGAGARQTKIEGTNDTENEAVGRFDGEFAWQLSDHADLRDETTIILGEERTTFDSTVALTSTIMDRFAVRLSFNVQHETNVERGTEETDTTTKASLVYSF